MEQIGLLSRARLRRALGDEKLKTEKLRVLHGIGTAIASAMEVDVILTRVVEAASFITEAEEASLLLLDEETDALYLRAQKGLGEKYARGFSIRTEDSIAGDVIRTGTPQRLASSDQNLKVVTGYMVNSIVYVPVIIRDAVIGVLSVDNRSDSRSFTDDDENLLSILAGYSAIALENARVLDELNNKAQAVSEMYGIDKIEPIPEIDLDSVSIVLSQSPELSPSKALLPQHLATIVDPYLSTIANVQHIIDEIEGRNPTKVRILAITHDLPTIASIEGVQKAVETINQTIVPWKQEITESMAQLLVQEKETKVRKAEAEVFDARARATKAGFEQEQLLTEAAIYQAEAERLNWEHERSRLELQHQKIQLALDFVTQIEPDLPTPEAIAYVVRLLPALDHIIASPLQVCSARERRNEDTASATTTQLDAKPKLQVVR